MTLLSRLRTHVSISILLLLFLLLGAVYSIVTPAFETPDEIWHYAFIHHLATGQGLPISEPNSQAMWRQQGVQAPAYYLAAAALTAWIDQSDFPTLYARANPHRAIGVPDAKANYNYLVHHADENWPWQGALAALHLARLFSVLLGALTLWATYRTLALLLPAAAALSATALVAFIPQFVFISAAVSNDNAVNALAALVLWRLSLLMARPLASKGTRIKVHALPGSMMREFWLLGILLGLAVLSKLSALGLLPLTGLVVLNLAWRRNSLGIVGQALVGIGIPVVAIGGWWYLRNWQLYGDPLAWNIWQANILLRVQPAGWRQIGAELTSLERSFWGLFGWLNVAYPEWVYTLLRAVEGLIALGIAVAVLRWMWNLRTKYALPDRFAPTHDISPEIRAGNARGWVFLLALLWLTLLAVSWLRFMRIAPAAQGRYFYPALPAIALLIYFGLDAWRIWTLRWLVVLLLFFFCAATPFWIIGPAYRPPPPNIEGLAQLSPIEAKVGAEFAIVGVKAQPDSLLPGQQAQIQIAWRAEERVVEDYSVFVHLIDTDGLIVAQYDTMPGGGLYPTSRWLPGELRVESYPIVLPTTAYTPNFAHWAVGLYRHSSAQSDPGRQPRLPVSHRPSSTTSDLTPLAEDALHFGALTIATPQGSVPNPIHAFFQDNITLNGYSFSRRLLRPGDLFTVKLYWSSRGAVKQDYTTFVHLLNQDFQMFGGNDDQPDLPTLRWNGEGIISDVHTFAIPEQTPPGQYQIELGLYTRPDFDRLARLESGPVGADRLLLGPLEVRP